jgi:outer membrane protein assembly factor BamB
VVGDHGGQSKIWAFNKLTGEKRWEKDRDEKTCWPTPVIATVDGRAQAIVVAVNAVRAYDVETGDVVWHASGLTREAIPSPLLGFGMVYVTSGSQDPFLMAIELGHTGDLTGTAAIKWNLDRNQPYISTPLLYGNKLYTLDSMKSSLSCYNAETGEPFYERQRLTGLKQMYSSAIGAAGRVYLTDRKGTTIVIRDSEKYEVLATNTLDDEIDASFAVVGNELYIKGKHFMYCIAGE